MWINKEKLEMVIEELKGSKMDSKSYERAIGDVLEKMDEIGGIDLTERLASIEKLVNANSKDLELMGGRVSEACTTALHVRQRVDEFEKQIEEDYGERLRKVEAACGMICPDCHKRYVNYAGRCEDICTCRKD